MMDRDERLIDLCHDAMIELATLLVRSSSDRFTVPIVGRMLAAVSMLLTACNDDVAAVLAKAWHELSLATEDYTSTGAATAYSSGAIPPAVARIFDHLFMQHAGVKTLVTYGGKSIATPSR
jgi:hypothetical protein